ncbi:Uncharacterised protein [Klebsiella aerogenes]|nr:Uncharacterised protein [Klebsiella aerogenes]
MCRGYLHHADQLRCSVVRCLDHPHHLRAAPGNQSVTGAYNAPACATVIENSVAGESLRLSYLNLTNNNGQAQWATADASGTSQSLEIYSMCPVKDSEQTAVSRLISSP